jgi:hypothetical protein
MIGGDRNHSRVMMATNSGSDLIYIADGDKELAGRIVKALLAQDYVSGPLHRWRARQFSWHAADINLDGAAVSRKTSGGSPGPCRRGSPLRCETPWQISSLPCQTKKASPEELAQE